jgi:hypothetical protein
LTPWWLLLLLLLLLSLLVVVEAMPLLLLWLASVGPAGFVPPAAAGPGAVDLEQQPWHPLSCVVLGGWLIGALLLGRYLTAAPLLGE